MPQTPGPATETGKIPALQGLRGYGCIAVFLVHFFRSTQFQWSVLHYPSQVLLSVGATALTVFFVLSGYLITGVLVESRGKGGYFKVFYGRRILRLLPAYYLTLIVIACLDAAHGISLGYQFWSQFLGIENLLPGYSDQIGPPFTQTAHLWSLAIEWQFYLVWPVVIWFFRDRRSLLRIAFVAIGASWLFRLACPLFQITGFEAYFLTPARVDAIFLGVVIALVRGEPFYERIVPLAKFAALAGTIFLAFLVIWKGEAWAYTTPAILVAYPCVCLTAAAVLIAVLEGNSLPARACSMPWIRWVGGLSYCIYLFHFAFRDWILQALTQRLMAYTTFTKAMVATAAVAFGITLILAICADKLIERPVRKLKDRLTYGPATKPEDGNERENRVLANSIS